MRERERDRDRDRERERERERERQTDRQIERGHFDSLLLRTKVHNNGVKSKSNCCT